MKKNKNNGFTLIELIAVLVILAVIALIVTPLVLNVVRKAKDSANKRSVDAYGKSIDLAVATYLMEKGDFPTSVSDLTIEYSGKEVVCGIKQLNGDSSIYLSECKVGGVEVKDSNTDDGWYHYGKSSAVVYQSYKIGDEVTYNGMNFYVIENSDEGSDSVTMLKAEPLSVDEVNMYGAGHINRYKRYSVGTAFNENGYGRIAYSTNKTCGYVNGSWIYDGCTTDYAQSEVKYVVDAWALDKFNTDDFRNDITGYSARLITYDELTDNLGYQKVNSGTIASSTNGETPEWIRNTDFNYWTMSSYSDSNDFIWFVESSGGAIYAQNCYSDSHMVRPVVTLLKSSLS